MRKPEQKQDGSNARWYRVLCVRAVPKHFSVLNWRQGEAEGLVIATPQSACSIPSIAVASVPLTSRRERELESCEIEICPGLVNDQSTPQERWRMQ
jgi:hypothetical protein